MWKSVRAKTGYGESVPSDGAGLARKREIVALTKCDAVTPEVAAEKAAELQRATRRKPLLLSAVSGTGVREVLLKLGKIVYEPKDKKEPEEPATSWEPELA